MMIDYASEIIKNAYEKMLKKLLYVIMELIKQNLNKIEMTYVLVVQVKNINVVV